MPVTTEDFLACMYTMASTKEYDIVFFAYIAEYTAKFWTLAMHNSSYIANI